ncbi:MAG: helix-turn-helix domain-containing protein [Planctomycetales bacterium]
MVAKGEFPKTSMILLDRRPKRAAAFAVLRPRVVSSLADLGDTIAHASRDSLWVSYSKELTAALLKPTTSTPATLGLGLFIHTLDLKSIPLLSARFRRIAFQVDGNVIPPEELAAVLEAENRRNLFIGGYVDKATSTITFWRGTLESLTVPFSAFERSGRGARPDFDAFSVIDCGQTVQLGTYEAAVDAILYESDPEFRRAISKRRQQEERSFGAALRRLRKQRGLHQEDFEPDIAAKTVARIEQGKVTRIQGATLAALARRLAVRPEEIATY